MRSRIVTAVGHRQVAAWLGYKSVSGVSRLRGGQRAPSRTVMEKIEDALNYPIADQVKDLERDGGRPFYEKLEEKILFRARLGEVSVGPAQSNRD